MLRFCFNSRERRTSSVNETKRGEEDEWNGEIAVGSDKQTYNEKSYGDKSDKKIWWLIMKSIIETRVGKSFAGTPKGAERRGASLRRKSATTYPRAKAKSGCPRPLRDHPSKKWQEKGRIGQEKILWGEYAESSDITHRGRERGLKDPDAILWRELQSLTYVKFTEFAWISINFDMTAGRTRTSDGSAQRRSQKFSRQLRIRRDEPRRGRSITNGCSSV